MINVQDAQRLVKEYEIRQAEAVLKFINDQILVAATEGKSEIAILYSCNSSASTVAHKGKPVWIDECLMADPNSNDSERLPAGALIVVKQLQENGFTAHAGFDQLKISWEIPL